MVQILAMDGRSDSTLAPSTTTLLPRIGEVLIVGLGAQYQTLLGSMLSFPHAALIVVESMCPWEMGQ